MNNLFKNKLPISANLLNNALIWMGLLGVWHLLYWLVSPYAFLLAWNIATVFAFCYKQGYGLHFFWTGYSIWIALPCDPAHVMDIIRAGIIKALQ